MSNSFDAVINRYDKVLDSYMNGNLMQMIEQFEALENKDDFIRYVYKDLDKVHELVNMLSWYFKLKKM